MICPECQGRLTLEAGYDVALLLICKNKMKKEPTCIYAKYLWELPKSLEKAIDDFLYEYEFELEKGEKLNK